MTNCDGVDKLLCHERLAHLAARTDITRRAIKTSMLWSKLSQFTDCLEVICKIDDNSPVNFNYVLVQKKPDELTLISTCSVTAFHTRQKNFLKIYNFSKGNVQFTYLFSDVEVWIFGNLFTEVFTCQAWPLSFIPCRSYSCQVAFNCTITCCQKFWIKKLQVY